MKYRIIFDVKNNLFYTQAIDESNTVITMDDTEILKKFGAVFKNRMGIVDNDGEYAIISVEQ